MGEFVGGAGMPFNTGMNTLGVGNPVPPSQCCMTGADFANDANNGSGDLWGTIFKTGKGKKKKDLIFTKPPVFGAGLPNVVYKKKKKKSKKKKMYESIMQNISNAVKQAIDKTYYDYDWSK